MSSKPDLEALAKESVWVEKYRYSDAERDYYSNTNSTEKCAKSSAVGKSVPTSDRKNKTSLNTSQSLVSDIVRARELINKTLDSDSGNVVAVDSALAARLKTVELENQTLKKTVDQLSALVSKLELRVSSLEGSTKSTKPVANQTAKPAPKPAQTKKEEEDDDDIDLFGSDVDEEADEIRKKRIEDYAAKKSKKPGVVAKSSVVLDVKPWDDETDMKVLEQEVRKIQMDGLLWGASKLVPLAYGIKKLQIVTVIEDEKVSVDELTELIQEKEEYVQSVDIAAFNKI